MIADSHHPTTPLAIACESGGFRCVFVHGVLAAFAHAGFRADAYAACSASVLPAAYAAVGKLGHLPVEYWHQGLEILREPESGMSEMILRGLARYAPLLEQSFFADNVARLLIATCAVTTSAAAAEAQGPRYSRLGRELLLAMARSDDNWPKAHLRLDMFDSTTDSEHQLIPANFRGVAYASTRMLHAWKVPAEIAGQPYIDGSYLCSLPVRDLQDRGYANIIAITTSHGPIFRSLFRTELVVEETTPDHRVRIISPDFDLKDVGVDFTKGTTDGIETAFQHGLEKGEEFLRKRNFEER